MPGSWEQLTTVPGWRPGSSKQIIPAVPGTSLDSDQTSDSRIINARAPTTAVTHVFASDPRSALCQQPDRRAVAQQCAPCGGLAGGPDCLDVSGADPGRSEERSVGHECVSTCRSRWSR